MYERVLADIEQGLWKEAREKMNQMKELLDTYDDIAAIIEAEICQAENDTKNMFLCLRAGLEYNYRNYELYYMLGNYYSMINVNQAYLCYENAEFYCDNEEDKKEISANKKRMIMQGAEVSKTAFVILSYNAKNVMQQCLESIWENNEASSYEIVVVDNASTDGVTDWLRGLKNIKLICNNENKGFSYGCNQGIKLAEPDSDIMLLNNDTIVTPNAIFWLRMGLYENEKVGATGSVSNKAGNYQMIEEEFETIQEYVEFAKKNNIPQENAFEKKVWLIGFAMLIKRSALDLVGLLDVSYSPGYFEDNDLGIRILDAGFDLLLCHNSFIYHYNGLSFGKNPNRNNYAKMGKENFERKWGFNIDYYTYPRMEVVEMLKASKLDKIRVLEIGCGCGVMLGKIKYLYPDAEVYGIEMMHDVAKIGKKYMNVIQGNIEEMKLKFPENYFDYIICSDVLEHLHNPKSTVESLTCYLKSGGYFLASIPNLMHWSVILPLLKGNFTYANAGLLDSTHIHMFTANEAARMFGECGYKLEMCDAKVVNRPQGEDEEMLNKILDIPEVSPKLMFLAYQYLVRARKI